MADDLASLLTPSGHDGLPDSIAVTPASPGYLAKIVVDKRELRSSVSKNLEELGIELEFRTLSVGDYVLSDIVGVERKANNDFFDTLFVRRELFSQLRDLKMAYRRPLLIIEGGYDALFTSRMVDPAAVWGVLETIAVGYRIPILYTLDCAETARVLGRIALKQQNHEKRSISLHGKRSHMSLRELQEYVISSIPDVGPKAAERLLAHFGSIEGVVNASKERLIEVDRIGPKIADRIRGLMGAEYVGEAKQYDAAK